MNNNDMDRLSYKVTEYMFFFSFLFNGRHRQCAIVMPIHHKKFDDLLYFRIRYRYRNFVNECRISKILFDLKVPYRTVPYGIET